MKAKIIFTSLIVIASMIIIVFLYHEMIHVSKEDKYRRQWYKYIGLQTDYIDSAVCAYKCGNTYKAYYWSDESGKAYDSAKVYYALMYPNGNPADIRNEIKKPKNCCE